MAAAKIFAAIMLIALMFNAGLIVDREHLKAVLKNAGLLSRVVLANFVIVPIAGVLLAKVFRLTPDVATGFLLMAIAPGVPFVIASVKARGGSFNMAVALALVLPLLSVVTIPLTAALILPAEEESRLPLTQFLVTLLVFQVLPLILGILFAASRFKEVVPKLERASRVVFLVAAVVVLIMLAPAVVRSISTVYGSFAMMAALCLTIVALATGFLLGGEREERRTLGLVTALRNIGLCLLIATTSFADTEVAAAVLSYFLVQLIVTSIVGIYFVRTTRRAVA